MALFPGTTHGPSATVIARTALPPAAALVAMADVPLPVMFTGMTPFPRVTEVTGQEGRWNRVGRSRDIHLADGGRVTETLIEWTEGVSFAYELTGFTDVFDKLVVGVRGEWSVAPDRGVTVIRWTWEFAARPGRRGLMALVIGPLWRRYMERMMRATVPTLTVPAAA